MNDSAKPRSMVRQCAAPLFLWMLVVLGGCVTTSSRPTSATVETTEAARYNLQLGVQYLRQNNYEAARQKLEKALEQDPGLATAHAGLGLVYERLEDDAGAERHYRRAADLAPSDPDILNSYAVFLCSTRRKPEAALKIFDRALAIPRSVKNVNRAVLYSNAGTCAKHVDLERAEGYLRSALSRDPAFPDALLQLAEVSLERDNPLQARAFLERFLATSNSAPGALWLGVRIEQRLDDQVAMRRYSDQLREAYPDSAEARLLDRLRDQERGEG